MMEKSHNKFKIGNRQKLGKTCQVCGKEGLAADIMRHIEAHHVEGVEIPCNHCEKIVSSRKNITHSNDVLCRTERSMERLVFLDAQAFLRSILKGLSVSQQTWIAG